MLYFIVMKKKVWRGGNLWVLVGVLADYYQRHVHPTATKKNNKKHQACCVSFLPYVPHNTATDSTKGVSFVQALSVW